MQIIEIPVLVDNYIFVLVDDQHRTAAVIDPALSKPVLSFLAAEQLELVAILITHHHHDHVGGNLDLLARFPQAQIYGGAEDRGRIPGQHVFLTDGDRVDFADRCAQVFFVPGHTKGHMAYYFPGVDSTPGDLFCGDTIFGGGCGRIKEGNPAQLWGSIERLRQLPADTRLWFAHEYTQKNLEFALTIEPDNLALQQRWQAVVIDRQQARPTVPSSIDLEQQTNPFLRCEVSSVQEAMASSDPLQVFTRLRGRKDHF